MLVFRARRLATWSGGLNGVPEVRPPLSVGFNPHELPITKRRAERRAGGTSPVERGVYPART